MRICGPTQPDSAGPDNSTARWRLTCKGELYTCLGQEGYRDLRSALRGSDDPAMLEAAIRAAR